MNDVWSRIAAIEFSLDPAWYIARWPWLVGAGALLLAFLLGRLGRGQGSGDLDPVLAERLAAHEQTLAQLAADVSNRAEASERRTVAESAALGERLTSLGRQQQGLGRALHALQGVLDNKQARGAFGEAQLERLVADLLPSASYRLQAPLGRNRVDCLIALPWPPGPVPVDAKFPLEAYQAWQQADGEREAARAARQFQRDVAAHVEAIRSKYLVPQRTADFALMFLPSEAVFSALHVHCRPAIEAAHRARVFPVSPSTLWPLLNTLAAVLRDVRFAEETDLMQGAAARLAEQSAAVADLARKTERDWSRLAGDLQSLIAAADALAASGRAFGGCSFGEQATESRVEDSRDG